MIFSAPEGNRRVAFDLYSNGTLVPPPGYASLSSAGQYVTTGKAWGLPVVGKAIRAIAEGVAMMEPAIYEKRDGLWQVADEAPQANLLTVEPNQEQSAFDFYAYAVACIEGWGNFCAQKVRALGRSDIIELRPFHPGTVRIEYRDGELRYKVREGREVHELTRYDVLHIPGLLTVSPYIGVSPIALHRDPLSRELALEEWQGAFYQNDATPPITITSNVFGDKQRRNEFYETWDARHKGAGRAHRPALLWGDMALSAIGVAPKDAEYVEQRKTGVRDVANMFGMDSGMLNDPEAKEETPEQTIRRFNALTVGPRVARIRLALWKDPDLFPDKSLKPGFTADVPTDAKTQAEVDHKRRQAGTRTANELRAKDGLPPHPDGDVLQVTPVGGESNPDTDDESQENK